MKKAALLAVSAAWVAEWLKGVSNELCGKSRRNIPGVAEDRFSGLPRSERAGVASLPGLRNADAPGLGRAAEVLDVRADALRGSEVRSPSDRRPPVLEVRRFPYASRLLGMRAARASQGRLLVDRRVHRVNRATPLTWFNMQCTDSIGMIAACHECNGKVSTEAGSCPHCGAPLKAKPSPDWAAIEESTAKNPAAIAPRRRRFRPGFGLLRQRVRPAGAPPVSFTWKAFAAFVFYWFFWLPGLIVTFMFLNEAKAEERRLGYSPHGIGCLRILLWSNIVFLFLTVLFFIRLMSWLGIKFRAT